MNNLNASFRSLVKNNNGFFKSEKQASFLLSKCDADNEFVIAESAFGNAYLDIFKCDNNGIYKVVRSAKKSADKVIWERDENISKEDAANKAEDTKARKARIIAINSILSKWLDKKWKLEDGRCNAVCAFMANGANAEQLKSYDDKYVALIAKLEDRSKAIRDKMENLMA